MGSSHFVFLSQESVRIFMIKIDAGLPALCDGGKYMKWNKFTIETTTAAEDLVSAMLAELGIEGVEIENNVPLTKEDQADMTFFRNCRRMKESVMSAFI